MAMNKGGRGMNRPDEEWDSLAMASKGRFSFVCTSWRRRKTGPLTLEDFLINSLKRWWNGLSFCSVTHWTRWMRNTCPFYLGVVSVWTRWMRDTCPNWTRVAHPTRSDRKGSFLLLYYFELKVERTCTGKWASSELSGGVFDPTSSVYWAKRFSGEFIKKKLKKKRRVRSAIAVSPDKVPFGGIINEEHWPGASFWRQGGMVLVGDSSYKISQIIPTISSINSGSGLHPWLFFIIIFFFYIKKKRIEVSDHKIKK